MSNSTTENEKFEWARERFPAHLSVKETRGIAFTIPIPEHNSSIFSTSPILDALARREAPSEN